MPHGPSASKKSLRLLRLWLIRIRPTIERESSYSFGNFVAVKSVILTTISEPKMLKRILCVIALCISGHSFAAYTVDVSATTANPITGLWWNANESGWGASIVQQYGTIFVTMYTYDAAGNPVWYVASNCPVVAGGCTGPLYKVTGGSMPTVTWNPKTTVATSGSITLTFTDANTGTMAYTIDGVAGSKSITRQVFGSPPVPTITQPTQAQIDAMTNIAIENIKLFLKSPSSFRLVGTPYAIMRQDLKTGFIQITFESQNSFGVYLRNNASCDFGVDQKTGIWSNTFSAANLGYCSIY